MKEVELFRIVHSDQSPECSMFLREMEGGRTFPIMIAVNEMAEIHRKVHGVATKRPMTHDLLRSLYEALGLTLERVEITELKDDVFYARMKFAGAGGAVDLDARPSDAVAVATAAGARLFVHDDILDSIGVVEDEEGEEEEEAS